MSVGQPGIAGIFDRVLHVGNIAQTHGTELVAGHDDVLVLVCLEDLVIISNLPGINRIGDFSLGPIRVGRAQRGAYLLHADSQLAQQRGIEFGAHRRACSTAHKYLSYPRHLRNLLRQDGIGYVIHARQNHSVRGERHNHDGRIRRIHFAVIGPGGQIGGKLAKRSIDGRLHVARGRINVAAEIKLKGNVG